MQIIHEVLSWDRRIENFGRMCSTDGRSPRSQRAVDGGRVAEQFHDSEFVKGVLQCVVRLAVGAVSGKQPKYGLYAVAAPQPPRGIQGRVSGDARVICAVGGKRHDVVPAEGGELGQMGAVEARVVGKHLLCTVGAQAGKEIVHRLFPGKKGVFVLARRMSAEEYMPPSRNSGSRI